MNTLLRPGYMLGSTICCVTACEIRNPELPREVHFRAIFAPKCIEIIYIFSHFGTEIAFSAQNPDSGFTSGHAEMSGCNNVSLKFSLESGELPEKS